MTATLNPEARFPPVRLQMPPIFIGVEAITLDFGPAHDGECIEVINQISPCYPRGCSGKVYNRAAHLEEFWGCVVVLQGTRIIGMTSLKCL
jgi:hypothetical protein